MIKGYFDESYNSRVFTFGGWVASRNEWKKIERGWAFEIKKANWKLPKDKKISRYHAADCSWFKHEFSQWEKSFRDTFVKRLRKIIVNRRIYAIACGVVLKDLIEVFPGNKNDAHGTAYTLALKTSMYHMGEVLKKHAPTEVITMFHDHSVYDGRAAIAFGAMKEWPEFPYQNYFTTIAPRRWQECIALQPADMIAYELFKELDRSLFADEREMRRFLKSLLGEKSSIGIRSSYLNKQGLEKIREMLGQNAAIITS